MKRPVVYAAVENGSIIAAWPDRDMAEAFVRYMNREHGRWMIVSACQ